MKKLFAFVAVALFSVATFASREVVPSDADLASYATKTYTMCIYNEGACNGIVLNGTYAGWPNAADHATLLDFVAVDGFEGWYVVTWDDESGAAEKVEEGGVQAKPIQLDGSNLFNWDYQLGPDAELIRGNAELLPGNNGTEVDIKNIQPGIVVIDVKSWKNNPCTAVYHVYNVTFISPDCNDEDYVVPAISGGFNGWAQQAMEMNELKTAERQQAGLPGAVFEVSFKAAEGSEFKFRSAEEWGKEWTNELKAYNAEEDAWGAYNGGANLVLGEETNLTFDLGDPEKYSWNNCEKPIEIEEKEFDYSITVANAPVCGEAVLSIVGGFEACGWTVANAVVVENGAAALHAKNTDEFKFLDKSVGDWSNEVQGFAQTTFYAADTADGEEDGKIAIDLAGTYFAACAPEEGIENITLTEKAQKVVVDGVLYIVRDNKMFNLQGAQVR
ncbi:MAG: hypothetical protein IJ554_02450 [Paludibacteraceae bacterium]|nr:hypothetical protein [Paludibacteraceae bacterium]MBR1381312.1 hypothetical protein [Paludibacteraceae bacterium]